MINQQLIASIKSDIKEGESLDSIKKFLIESNVDLDIINEAISYIAKEESSLIEEHRDNLLNIPVKERIQNIDKINAEINSKEVDYSIQLINNEKFRYESKKLVSNQFKANDLIPGDHIPKNSTLEQIKDNKTFIIIVSIIFFVAIISITLIYFLL